MRERVTCNLNSIKLSTPEARHMLFSVESETLCERVTSGLCSIKLSTPEAIYVLFNVESKTLCLRERVT